MGEDILTLDSSLLLELPLQILLRQVHLPIISQLKCIYRLYLVGCETPLGIYHSLLTDRRHKYRDFIYIIINNVIRHIHIDSCVTNDLTLSKQFFTDAAFNKATATNRKKKEKKTNKTIRL